MLCGISKIAQSASNLSPIWRLGRLGHTVKFSVSNMQLVPTQKTLRNLTAVALALLFGNQTVLICQTARIAVSGLYRNSQYAFAARIPSDFSGYRLAAPAPNHGFNIDLPGRGNDVIWVYAEYDALLLQTVEAVAKREQALLSMEHHVALVKSTPLTLEGLEAKDMVLENTGLTGDVNYVRLIVAYRGIPNGVGVIYELGVQQKDRDAVGDKLLSDLLKSFALI
jgi:hypothetical protein